MTTRKKQEEKHLQVLKSMQQQEPNKKCFECDQRGPTYIDVTIGSFVCTSCGGILRGLNPPHRIKSVSMATFTPAEITFMESRGNDFCKKVYLGKFESSSKPRPDSKDHAKLKFFMEQKYEHKRWYVSPDQVHKSYKDDTTVTKSEPAKPLTTLLGNNAPQLKVESQKNPKVGNILGDFGSAPTSSSVGSQSTSNSGFADFGNAFTSQSFEAFGDFTSGATTSTSNGTTKQSGFADFSNFVTPTNASPQITKDQAAPQPTSKSSDKYADLADLFSTDVVSSNADMWSGSTANNTLGVGWGSKSIYGAQPVSTSLNMNNPQSSVFGSPKSASVFGSTPQQPSVFSNTTQQQPSVFSNTTQQQSNVFGNSTQQQQSVFGNPTQQQQQQSVFGNSTQQQNVFGNTAQQQPSVFGSVTQQQPSVYGTQGSPLSFSNSPQSTMTSQPSSAFVNQQTNNIYGNTVQPTPSPYGYLQPNPNTVGTFGSSQFNTATPTPAMNTQAPRQPFMPVGTTGSNVPNPFIQPGYAVTTQMHSQNASNPFMAQAQGQKAFPQPTGNNPFMSSPTPAPAQSQMSTNPFF